MRFLPHVTVATIVEHQSRFLMVEEKRDGRIVLNQPAGHLEANETLLQAATRRAHENFPDRNPSPMIHQTSPNPTNPPKPAGAQTTNAPMRSQ